MPEFRDTLRVYSLDPGTCVRVRVVRVDETISKEFDLDMLNGSDIFHPGYAQFGDFNLEPYSVRVEIQPHASSSRIWAFVSITHNETQRITIVTPH
jgi:hypothetical protein